MSIGAAPHRTKLVRVTVVAHTEIAQQVLPDPAEAVGSAVKIGIHYG